MTQNKDELYHYGVPGMKWGKRKGPLPSSASLMSKIKKQDAKIKSSKTGFKKSKIDYENNYDDYFEGRTKTFDKTAKSRVQMKNAKEQYKLDKRMAKELKKEFIKSRAKEIRKGQNIVAKIFGDLFTDRKLQAEIEYERRYMKD